MTGRTATGVLLGVAAGFVGGLFGVGGGIVLVPGMVLLLGIAQSRAHATSVAAIAAAATAAVIPLVADGRVHWATVGLLLAGSLGGAYAGARIMVRISDVWLARGFLALIVAAAARMAFLTGPGGESEATAAAVDLSPWAAALVLIGLAAGALAAVLGIGGGIVFVPALVTLYAFPQHVAQATSLAVIVPTMLAATLAHAEAKRVDWTLAVTLGAGSILGGLAGALTALEVEALVLRRLFAGLLVLIAVRMLMTTARTHVD